MGLGSFMHDQIFSDPSKETSLRIQNAKETLLERSKVGTSPWKERDCQDGSLLERKPRSGSTGGLNLESFSRLNTVTVR